LSRAIARDRDVAIRVALGAGRWRLVRLHVVESLVLSALGAVAGGAIATWGVRLLTRMVPVQLPRWMTIDVDARVVVYLAVVAVVTGIASGLVPAFRGGGSDLLRSLKEGTPASSGGTLHNRFRNALIVAEVALALVLLVGASLLLESVWRLNHVDLGFRSERALTFRVELGWRAYTTLQQTVTFHRRVMDRIRQLPGVEAITFDNNVPMSGKPRSPYAIRAEGQTREQEADNPYVNLHLVGPDYFRVMGIELLRGRGFEETDGADGVSVVVVSDRLAARLWPGRDPIGRRLQPQNTTTRDAWQVVVGVARPVLHHELDGDPGYDTYRPYTQSQTAGPWYVIRTSGDPMALARVATAIIGETDPNQSFLDVQSYERRVANRIWQRRLAGALFGSFAILALVLAAVGLYGVLSYLVGQQTREIGLRMALGAAPQDVVRMVLRRGMSLTVAGIAIGLVLALGLARAISGILYQVSAADPLTFSAVPAVLAAIAALACYLPARRATRVDPLIALRAQ
jgi:putative ABC transport system permease protein